MSIVEAWVDRIRHDLTPFIDPSTTLEISSSGNVVDVIWTQRRRLVSARFVVRDSDGVYVILNDKELSYRAFFASEDMADIAGIAKTSSDILKVKLYVETRASSEDYMDGAEVPALDVISSLVANRSDDSTLTNFLMITGEAGAGKTSVLKELVRRQSDKYLSGSSDFVYLYINAQGRALARFNEAVSTELNELRVNLPHYAVAPMVKMGLIVPVIDGFDELIGVGGYDDAFSSISSFVQDLDGKGSLVASARSTYYEQEFLSRAARSAVLNTDAWKLTSVAVSGWGLDERRRYVEAKLGGETIERVDQALVSLNKIFSGENEPLSSKPLFVARATDFLFEGLLSEEEGALLERLVGAFIVREQREKLLRKSGENILSEEQILSLCSDLAEEMWNLGTRELDRATVRELAELATTDVSVLPSDRQTVIERMPNMAFLQPGESMGSVAFEHEIFFDYFLAYRIANIILSDSPALQLLLSRSSMPDSLANGIAGDLAKRTAFDLKGFLLRLCSVSFRSSPRQQLVRENSGRLVSSVLTALNSSNGVYRDLSVNGLVFPGSNFHGLHFLRLSLANCEFRRCDLTSTFFRESTASDVVFESPLIDGQTELDIAGLELPSFVGVRVAEDEGVRTVYEPHATTDILIRARLPVLASAATAKARKVSTDVIRVIERLCKAYAKCNPICLQDAYLGSIFNDSAWPEIQRIGVESGIFKPEIRAANGPRRDFIRRLVRPEDLLSGLWENSEVPISVSSFWKRIEDEFPFT